MGMFFIYSIAVLLIGYSTEVSGFTSVWGQINRYNSKLLMGVALDTIPSSQQQPGTMRSSFQERMRKNIYIDKRKAQSLARKRTKSGTKPENIHTAYNLADFKALVGEEREQIVVVRFYATWCKACKAIGPSFYRLAKQYEDKIKFVEVPVTDQNAELHQGLGIPSLPFGHIYHPVAGLVEERRISKRNFREFEEVLQWYDQGYCNMDESSIKDNCIS